MRLPRPTSDCLNEKLRAIGITIRTKCTHTCTNIHIHSHRHINTVHTRIQKKHTYIDRLTDRVVPDNGFLFKDQKGHQ